MEKKTYNAAEKKAYYMGLGAALTGGRADGIKTVMNGMPPAVRQSYKNGLDDGYMKKVKGPKKNKR